MDQFQTPAVVDEWRQRALIVGVIASVISVAGAFFQPSQFFHSYLFAYVFWIGLSLGSMAIYLIHAMTGGGWGAVIRRILEASTRVLPLMGLLFLPIVLAVATGRLYIWSNPEVVAANEVLQRKAIYLNNNFFYGRAAIYFAVWLAITYQLNKWSQKQDEAITPKVQTRLQEVGGFGLLLYGLTMTFAAIDWMMSLDPEWPSTMYGLMVITGQVLSSFAFVIAVASKLVDHKPMSDYMGATHFHDLGKLLLAFVMIWAYLSFSQFLIIWSGNLPEEIPWYIHRIGHGWQIVALALVLFHFALPFLLLLSRTLKQKWSLLTRVAIAILVMRFVDLFWLIAPEFSREGLSVHWMDFTLPIGIGGLWLAGFFYQLKGRPLLPVNDPDLKEVVEHGHA